jgi:hypothetical protein
MVVLPPGLIIAIVVIVVVIVLVLVILLVKNRMFSIIFQYFLLIFRLVGFVTNVSNVLGGHDEQL